MVPEDIFDEYKNDTCDPIKQISCFSFYVLTFGKFQALFCKLAAVAG